MSRYAQPGPTPLAPFMAKVDNVEPEDLVELEQQTLLYHKAELPKLMGKAQARQHLAEIQASSHFQEPIHYANLADMAEAYETGEEDIPLIHGGLMGVGDLVTITGQAKQGKTTTVMNLAKALSEGTPFLGHADYRIDRPYRVDIFDGEMPAPVWVRSMLKTQPSNMQGIGCINWRGFKLDLCTSFGVDYTINKLRQLRTEVWIIDNFSKFSHSVESTNDDVQINAFHQNVQIIMEEVGLLGTVLVHHAGHTTGRARGSSVFRDRPDVLWDMVKTNPPQFVISGRHAPEFKVRTVWDAETNTLTYADTDTPTGNPVDSDPAHPFRTKILTLIVEQPGITFSQLVRRVDQNKRVAISDEVRAMEKEGIVRHERQGRGIRLFPSRLIDSGQPLTEGTSQ